MKPSSLPSCPHSHPVARHMLAVLAALSLLLVSTAVWAAEPAAAAAAMPDTSIELPTGPAPWRAREGQPRAALQVEGRLPVSTAPQAGWTDPRTTRLSYVRWAPAGERSALGLSMGVSSRQPGNYPAPWAPGAAPAATLSPELGVRWRSGWSADHRVDVNAWSSYDTTAGMAAAERRSYNARVELQFRESRSKFGFDGMRGALGMQLSGNSQMLLRSRHGGPMLYYRAKW